MNRLHAIWATVVEVAQMEIRDGVITKQKLQTVVAWYQRNSLSCLSSMVHSLVEGKMLATALRLMVDDEVKEVFGDDGVEDFE